MATQRSGMAGRLLRAGLLGAVAAAGVLGLDLGLMRSTLGFVAAVDAGAVLAYVSAGVVVAMLAEAALRMRGVPEGAAGTTVARTAALLCLPAVLERADHLLGATQIPGRTLLALVAGVGAYWGWLAGLKRLCVSARWAWTLGAFSVALVLAANRNLAPGAFSTTALVLDGAIAAAALALALSEGLRGGGRIAAGAVALTGFAVVVAFLPREPREELPSAGGDNLFLVVVDTLRLDVFADVVARTPEGERFSRALAGATWFDHATAIAPWTAPSMASILTGLYPAEHGFDSPGGASAAIPPLAPQIETLAQRLERRGYHCEGLITQPYIRPGTGMERGFAHYELVESVRDRLPLLVAMTRAGLIRAQPYQPAASVRRRLAQRLEKLAESRKPLFFFVHLLDPHVPLHAHPELPADAVGDALPADENLYRQEVRYALAEIAAMVELLATKDLLSHSVVAVTSDHGELFQRDERFGRRPEDGAPLRLEGHGSALYGELLRVPLVVRPPAARQAQGTHHSEALASHVDLVPTFLDLLGLAPRPGAERFSLAGEITGAPQPASARESAPSGVNVLGRNPALPAQLGLRNRRYWLIHYLEGELPDELYDLAADPGERLNLAAEQPDLVRAVRAQLEQARPWMTPSLAPPAPLALDAETRRRLKALGYL